VILLIIECLQPVYICVCEPVPVPLRVYIYIPWCHCHWRNTSNLLTYLLTYCIRVRQLEGWIIHWMKHCNMIIVLVI